MRENKYRGKRKDNGKWVYGYYLKSASDFIAVDDGLIDGHWDIHEVIPETVGQFIGARNDDKQEIYEGDIVEAWSQGVRGRFEIRWRQEAVPCWILYPAFQSGEMWNINCLKQKDGLYYDSLKIIGNIHDNPELLEASSS